MEVGLMKAVCFTCLFSFKHFLLISVRPSILFPVTYFLSIQNTALLFSVLVAFCEFVQAFCIHTCSGNAVWLNFSLPRSLFFVPFFPLVA